MFVNRIQLLQMILSHHFNLEIVVMRSCTLAQIQRTLTITIVFETLQCILIRACSLQLLLVDYHRL